jgi:hypothetical protein
MCLPVHTFSVLVNLELYHREHLFSRHHSIFVVVDLWR